MDISRSRKALLAGLVGLAMSVGGAATANAATTEPAPDSSAAENAPGAQAATHSDCYIEIIRQPGNFMRSALSVVCSDIDEGVQVRGVLDVEANPDDHTPWLDPSQVGQTVVSGRWTDSSYVRAGRIEERVDPSRPGVSCAAKMVVTKERTLRYDEHAAELTCSSVPEGIKVRAVGDYSYQTDTHTEYLAAPGTVRSPAQTRTDSMSPKVRI